MSFTREKMRATFVKIVLLCFFGTFLGTVWYLVKWTIENGGEKWTYHFEKFEESTGSRTNGRQISENSLEKYVEPGKSSNISVSVDVYYESLNSDSYVFVKEQLKSVVDRLQNRVAVKFVPFGKSNFLTRGKSTVFYCHHGPKECQGNRYHACILTRSKDQTQQTNMVLCMLEKGFVHSMETAAELCCASFGMDFLDVRGCAANQEGRELLAKHAESTKNVDVRFVPMVAVNGVMGPQAFQRRVFKNLKDVICDILVYRSGIKVNEFCRKDAVVAELERSIQYIPIK